MPTITVADVQATFEDRIPDESAARVEALIAEVLQLVSERVGDVDAWTVAQDGRAATLRSVVVAAVQRVLRSPGAFRSESEGGYSYSLDSAAAGISLRITDDEWRRLLADRSGGGTYGAVRLRIPEWSGRQWPNSTRGRFC